MKLRCRQGGWALPLLALVALSACRVVDEAGVEPPQLSVSAAGDLGSLKSVDVPRIPDLDSYVKSKAAAVALGKAMFWDQAVGSDGLACASCHYHAGADNRVKNQLNPGLLGDDTRFQRTASGGKGGPNYRLKQDDFPFHQPNNPADRDSAVRFSSNDTASSQGVYLGSFEDSPHDSHMDKCVRSFDPVYHVGSYGTRRVEPRNTPTTINAVFNFRNFWDGRANNAFNGVNPFGPRDGGARVLINDNGEVKSIKVDLRNASLASQGVGPVTSDIEMICNGRAFASFGRKMLARPALSLQAVHPQDSVLASLRHESGKGLTATYEELIKAAFADAYWNADAGNLFNGYTQMESNFSFFWGVALQLYQATLVSDEAPFDRWAEGSPGALSKKQQRGLTLFSSKGKCINCHKGPEFSGAASVLQAEAQEGGLVERMAMGDGGVALYDNGFYNIGVTPTRADIGVGGTDPFGKPLSFTRQYSRGNITDHFSVDSCTFEVPFDASNCRASSTNLGGERTAVDGAFKTPTLRNVELTGPYFHNGGTATLKQVVEFYNRGGNFKNPELDPDITPLGLSDDEISDLTAFMLALTDPRVKNEAAPFDHPQLFIPNGHPGNETRTQGGEFGQADLARTEWLELPAVGSGGRSAAGLRPLRDFSWTLRNRGPDLALARPFDPANQPPTLPPTPDRVDRVGTTINLQFTARDADGDRIFYSASGLPRGVRMTLNGRLTGQLRQAGEFLVTIVAYDNDLGAASTTFRWTVN